MKFIDLKASLDKKIFNCYIVGGDDAFLRMSSEKLIKSKVVTDFAEMNITNLEGNTSIDKLLDTLNTLPILNPYKLTIVSDYAPEGEDRGQILEYFKDPNPNSVVVFVSKSDFLKRLADKYPDTCTYVDCSFLGISTIKKWLSKEFSASGVELTPSAADLLCNYCGFDMTRLSSETPKLAALGKSSITESDIVELVVPESSYQIYELSNKISEKNADKSLEILQKLLASNSPVALLSSIYNHFRRMFYVSVSGESDSVLAGKLGVKEYAITKTRQSVAQFKPAKLKKIIDTLYNAEVNIKTGKMKDIDAIYFVILKVI